MLVRALNAPPHLTFTCSKSKVETIEKGVKYFEKLTVNTRATS